MQVRLQSTCSSKPDALTVEGFLDRGREADLATDGRSMEMVSGIVFVPVAPQEDTPSCRWLKPVANALGNGH